MRRLRGRVRRWRSRMWVMDNWHVYRMGYIAALDDVERTGLRPVTDEAKREAADHSLRRFWDVSDE